MTPGILIQELQRAFEDWDGLLVNPRYCRSDNAICWTAFNGGRVRDPITSSQLLAIVEQKQFTFQSAEDGSIFQLLYRFDNSNKLLEARLAFYLIRSRGSLEEGTAEIKSTAWVRIDYDDAAAAGVLHSACHLHLHGFPEARIIVDGIPGPRQFVEFIVAACYPNYYEIHRLDGGNSPSQEAIKKINACMLAVSGGAPALLHLALPKSVP